LDVVESASAITLLNDDGMTLAVLKYILFSQSGWM
jgi:hypothetical protein